MTYFGVQAYLNGYDIFANYHLKGIPYVFIDCMDDLSKPIELDHGQRKVFLCDDIEYWFNSRMYKSDINREISKITLLYGKVSCSTIWSAKRGMALDNSLREITDYFCEVDLELAFRSCDKRVDDDLHRWLNYLRIVVPVLDNCGNLVDMKYLYNLDVWARFYDTREFIRDIYSSGLDSGCKA